MLSNLQRPPESLLQYSKLHGEFRLCAPSGASTVVAAGTTTAGHIFAMRWTETTKKAIIRYVKADFILTTAFGAAQSMGVDLIAARSYSASHTGGTAIDAGSTITGSGKLRTGQDSSLFIANSVRIGSTGALTAGTQTLDANALASGRAHMGAIGATLSVTLLDARVDGSYSDTLRSPIVLSQNEGIVLRNLVLMGATGVGTWDITVEWDEVTM